MISPLLLMSRFRARLKCRVAELSSEPLRLVKDIETNLSVNVEQEVAGLIDLIRSPTSEKTLPNSIVIVNIGRHQNSIEHDSAVGANSCSILVIKYAAAELSSEPLLQANLISDKLSINTYI